MTDPSIPTPDEPERPETQQPGPKPDNPVFEAGKFASDQTSATVIAYLVTGPALFGGLGWLLDRWLGTGFIVLLGLLGGMGLSLYVIWLRYGTQ
jgi:F0F1-type ATP synthase assembly protein I